MYKKVLIACLLGFGALLAPNTAHALTTQAPIITEVYPAPTTGQQEWIELFNPSEAPLSLSGYTLHDSLTTPSVIFTGSEELIEPLSFIVITLTSSKLNNTGDAVTLYSPDGQLLDTVSYITTSQGESWHRAVSLSPELSLGTESKGSEEVFTTSPEKAEEDPEPATLETATTSATLQPLPTTTADTSPFEALFLSEFHPCPQSGSEWLELYNAGTESSSIEQLKIVDDSGNTKLLSGTVQSKQYQTFNWQGSLLNNTGDAFSLVTTAGETLITVSYEACSNNASFVYTTLKQPTGWYPAEPTPNAENKLLVAKKTLKTLETSSSALPELLAEAPQAAVSQPQVLSATTTTVQRESPLSLSLRPPLLTATPSAQGSIAPEHATAITTAPPQRRSTQLSLITKAVLGFTCLGSFSGGTLLLYEKIKHTVSALA